MSILLTCWCYFIPNHYLATLQQNKITTKENKPACFFDMHATWPYSFPSVLFAMSDLECFHIYVKLMIQVYSQSYATNSFHWSYNGNLQVGDLPNILPSACFNLAFNHCTSNIHFLSYIMSS
jgi:hypothetical protein